MAATLQRKSSGGIIFVIITKITTKIIVPRNYFVIISAMMVCAFFRPLSKIHGDSFSFASVFLRPYVAISLACSRANFRPRAKTEQNLRKIGFGPPPPRKIGKNCQKLADSWVAAGFRLPSTPTFLQYKKKILRGINFVKITKNIFQST